MILKSQNRILQYATMRHFLVFDGKLPDGGRSMFDEAELKTQTKR